MIFSTINQYRCHQIHLGCDVVLIRLMIIEGCIASVLTVCKNMRLFSATLFIDSLID